MGRKSDSGVMTSVGRKAVPRRRNGGDNNSWANADFTGLKNAENSRG
jgi:hypothetical protein